MRSTVKSPVAEFHRPPPSAPAVLLATRLPLTLTLPVPVRCRAPPLPGTAPVVLPVRRLRAMTVVPPLASMPPPARSEELRLTRLSTTRSIPPSFMIAPPDAPSPVTVDVRRLDLRTWTSPRLRMRPPLSVSTGAPFLRRSRLITRRLPLRTSKTRSTPLALIDFPRPMTTRLPRTSRSPRPAPPLLFLPVANVIERSRTMRSLPEVLLALRTALRSCFSVRTLKTRCFFAAALGAVCCDWPWADACVVSAALAGATAKAASASADAATPVVARSPVVLSADISVCPSGRRPAAGCVGRLAPPPGSGRRHRWIRRRRARRSPDFRTSRGLDH